LFGGGLVAYVAFFVVWLKASVFWAIGALVAAIVVCLLARALDVLLSALEDKESEQSIRKTARNTVVQKWVVVALGIFAVVATAYVVINE
jgi:beta-lactamase regulating signal transducer with metallopeptidase domain